MAFFIKIFQFLAVILYLLPDYAMAQNLPIPTPKPQQGAKQSQTKAVTPTVTDQRVYQSACPAVLLGQAKAELLPPISQNQCGERSPYEVSEITGIRLTQKATLNCGMITTLVEWTKAADTASREVMNSGLSAIATSTSYQCRRRNNAPDGKISEHGFANALDVTGFRLVDGSEISVLNDWTLIETGHASDTSEASGEAHSTDHAAAAKYLRRIHALACERFTTVLGPDSDTHHEDHFHLDLGCHGKTCTYRICQ